MSVATDRKESIVEVTCEEIQESLAEVEETEQQRLDRLGREKPPQFYSFWSELFFVYSIIALQFMVVCD